MTESSLTDRLRSGAVWVIGCRLLGIATNIVVSVLVARALNKHELRDYVLFFSIMQFGAILATFGLNEAGLRFIAESLGVRQLGQARKYLRQVIWIGLGSSTAAMLVMAVYIYCFRWNLDEFLPVGVLVGGMSLGLLVLAWQMIGAESLRGYQEIRYASLFSGGLAGGPISNGLLLFTLLVVIYGWGSIGLATTILLSVASIAVTVPVTLFVLRQTSLEHQPVEDSNVGQSATKSATNLFPDTPVLRQVFTVAAVLMLIQALAFALQQADLWIGGSILAKDDLAVYSIAKRFILLVAMPVQMAMLTVISSIPDLYGQRRLAELQRMLRTTALLAAIPSLAALVALVLFPETVLHLIFWGSQDMHSYDAAAGPLRILAVGYLVLVLLGNPIHSLTLTGHHQLAMLVNLLAALFLVGFGFLGTQWWGSSGLAWAASLTLALQNVLLWILARRYVGIWTHIGWPEGWTKSPGAAEFSGYAETPPTSGITS